MIPTRIRRQVLDRLHECHFGIQRSKQLTSTAVYWPNIDSDILDLCRQCPICAGHQSQGRIKGGATGQLPRTPRFKGAPRDEIYLFQIKYSFEKFS